mmetsp:Transcript_44339/g.81552  ORF Transcript_44339/g.81552 Transcript_44339/m.81552 type:complete len:230 (+) Transcript_44339:117-806(+)
MYDLTSTLFTAGPVTLGVSTSSSAPAAPHSSSLSSPASGGDGRAEPGGVLIAVASSNSALRLGGNEAQSSSSSESARCHESSCSKTTKTAATCFLYIRFCSCSSTKNLSTSSLGSSAPNSSEGDTPLLLDAWMTARRNSSKTEIPSLGCPGGTQASCSMLLSRRRRWDSAPAFSIAAIALHTGWAVGSSFPHQAGLEMRPHCAQGCRRAQALNPTGARNPNKQFWQKQP